MSFCCNVFQFIENRYVPSNLISQDMAWLSLCCLHITEHRITPILKGPGRKSASCEIKFVPTALFVV